MTELIIVGAVFGVLGGILLALADEVIHKWGAVAFALIGTAGFLSIDFREHGSDPIRHLWTGWSAFEAIFYQAPVALVPLVLCGGVSMGVTSGILGAIRRRRLNRPTAGASSDSDRLSQPPT